jgi:hypothetical protein
LTDIINTYEVAVGDDVENCSTPALLPCVISHRWNKINWQGLAEELFAMDPLGIIRAQAELHLANRFDNDLRGVVSNYFPHEDMVAFVAVRGTRASGMLKDEAQGKLMMKIQGEADRDHGGSREYVKEQFFMRDGHLDYYATPEQILIVEEFERQVALIKAGKGPTNKLRIQLEFENAQAVNRLIDCYKTGYGTLLTAKLFKMLENPRKHDLSEDDDIAPGSLVKVTSEVDVEEKATVKLSTGETVDLADLPRDIQRDVRRGFGVSNMAVSTNSDRKPGFTGYKKRRTTVMPDEVDYTRLVTPNGNMNHDEWARLMRNPFDSVSHLGQTVLTMNVKFYTSGPEYKQYGIDEVKVCPAPIGVISMFERLMAEDVIHNEYAAGVQLREAQRVTKRKRTDRDESIATKAARLVGHLRGPNREREYTQHVDRLTYRARQAAIAERVKQMNYWD